jgi:hypothetical protein
MYFEVFRDRRYIPPITTNQFLDYCFLHKTKPFEYQKNSDEGKYKQCNTLNILKIYNKALHYSQKGSRLTPKYYGLRLNTLKCKN